MPPVLLTFHIQDGLRVHVPCPFHATSLPARVCFPAKAGPGVCHQSHQISSCPPELFTAARPVTGHQKALASNAAHQEPWLACGTPMWPLQKSHLGL